MSDAGSTSSQWDALRGRLSSPGMLGDPGGAARVPRVVVRTSSPHVSTTDVCVSTYLASVEPGTEFCGGRVGGGTAKFCTLPCLPGTKSCRFVAHAQKAKLVVPAYYICTSKPSVAFTEPLVAPSAADGVFSEAVVSAMTDSRTLKGWNDLFGVLNCFADDMEEAQQVETITRATRPLAVGFTPMKPRNVETDMEADMLHIADSDSWGRSELSDCLMEPYQLDDDTEALTHVRAHWNILTAKVMVQDGTMNGVDKTLRALLEEVDQKAVTSLTSLGEPKGDVPALTVWGSITEVMKELNIQRGDMTTVNEGIRKLMEGHRSVIQMVKGADMSKATEMFKELSLRVQGIDKVVNGTVFPLVKDVIDKMDSLQPGGGQEMSRVLNRLHECEVKMAALERDRTMTTEGAFVGGASVDVSNLKLVVGSLTDEVARLRADNVRLRVEMDTDSINFGGFAFQSSASYIEFVETHVPSNSWRYCYDFVSIFTLYNPSEAASHQDDGLKASVLVGKAGYADTESARIDTSFRTMIPFIFGAEQESLDTSKKMAKLKTMEIWEHPHHQAGLKEDIKNFFELTISALLMQIESEFGANQRSSMFFSQMINGVLTFWNALEAWISRFEKELTGQLGGDNSKYHKKSVWHLICWMLHAMFKEMLKRRQAGQRYPVFSSSGSRTEEDLKCKCASMIEGTINAHKFMKELVADNFSRHSIFASTMTEFTIKNKAAQTTVDELKEEFSVWKTQMKGIQANVDRANQNQNNKNNKNNQK